MNLKVYKYFGILLIAISIIISAYVLLVSFLDFDAITRGYN
jgi:hypothetical protein